MIFIKVRLGIGGIQVNHSERAIEHFQRHSQDTVDAALQQTGGVGKRLGGRQVVAQNGDAVGKNLRDNGAAHLHRLVLPGDSIPTEDRRPLIRSEFAK